jgi:hypothetical protein
MRPIKQYAKQKELTPAKTSKQRLSFIGYAELELGLV